MAENFDWDVLARQLNLSAYQVQTLVQNQAQYNMGRMEKRGGLLYVPRRRKIGLFDMARDILMGRAADLIGADRTLHRARRGLKFCAAGYHIVNIGKFKCYCDPNGYIISRDDFNRAMRLIGR